MPYAARWRVSRQTRCSAHTIAWLHPVSLMISKTFLSFMYIRLWNLLLHWVLSSTSQSNIPTVYPSFSLYITSITFRPYIHLQYKHVFLNSPHSRCLPGHGQRSSSPSPNSLHNHHLQRRRRRKLPTQRPPRRQLHPNQSVTPFPHFTPSKLTKYRQCPFHLQH